MIALPGRLVLLGHPIAHSLSPVFQNAALRSAALPLVYEALDVPPPALEATVAGLRDIRAAGNVTIPHKARVAALCDALTPLARRLGAVNTFWVRDGQLIGDNTDAHGVSELLRALGTPAGVGPVAVLGAGGAAAAVLAALEELRARDVRVWNRTAANAERLSARFPGLAAPCASLGDAVLDARLVVNTTPAGQHDDGLPMAIEDLRRDALVADLVYRPGETAWVRTARAAGHRAADGLTMLLAQGALAFERWFGFAPDRAAMRAALGVDGPR